MNLKKEYQNIFSFLFNDENRNIVYLSIGILIFSFIIGIFRSEWLIDYHDKILPTLLNGEELHFFDILSLLLWTNIKASFLGLFFGIFLIPTIVLSLVNGYVFGAVTSNALNVFGIKQVMLRIMPHAVFEIPIIIMSYAYGLIIGISVLKKIKGEKISIIEIYKKGIKLFILVLLPLLVIAATIESLLIRYMDVLLKFQAEQILFSLIILYLFYLTSRMLRLYLLTHEPKFIFILAVVFVGTLVLWTDVYGLRVLELLEQSVALKMLLILIPVSIFFLYIYLENRRYNEEKAKKQIKGAFQQYVSPELIKELTKHPEKLKLGGEKKELTIFFSDIRSFTSISEKLTPEELVHLMNDYLSAMSDIILERKGVIDKYIGDAIMAFWNAPLDVKENEESFGKTSKKMGQAGD